MTRGFTAYVVNRDEGDILHADPKHQLKLSLTRRDLGRTHALGYCQGCQWYLPYPLREIDILNQAVFQHMTHVHFDALLDGRAHVDPDLVDGGDAWLRERFRSVHIRSS